MPDQRLPASMKRNRNNPRSPFIRQAQRRLEAEARQDEHNSRSNEDQLALLQARGAGNCAEARKLAMSELTRETKNLGLYDV